MFFILISGQYGYWRHLIKNDNADTIYMSCILEQALCEMRRRRLDWQQMSGTMIRVAFSPPDTANKDGIEGERNKLIIS